MPGKSVASNLKIKPFHITGDGKLHPAKHFKYFFFYPTHSKLKDVKHPKASCKHLQITNQEETDL